MSKTNCEVHVKHLKVLVNKKRACIISLNFKIYFLELP